MGLGALVLSSGGGVLVARRARVAETPLTAAEISTRFADWLRADPADLAGFDTTEAGWCDNASRDNGYCLGSGYWRLFFGRTFGSHKLAPSISPGKTWEGAVGGGLTVIVYGFVFSSKLPAVLSDSFVLLLSALILLTVISIMGDLFESLLKRQAGLKDSSNVLPGHGGVLDRIDSLTSTLPLVALAWLTVVY